MPIAAFKRYLQESPAFRRVAEVVDFVTYREVREFDFARAHVPPKAKHGARES